MTQLDTFVADHLSADHPESRLFRRELLIELRKAFIVRRGVTLRLRERGLR